MARLAYLGGGRMARAMAARQLAAGHAVTIYNRSAEKLADLRAQGAAVAATPREAAEAGDVIFSCVTDDAASRFVWDGPDGALAASIPPGRLLVEHSTLSHEWVLELSRTVAGRSLRYVDAPVAGRPDAAAAGRLAVFAGAARPDLDELAPLLQPISRETFHFGPPGTGTAFKLIYNLMGAVQIVALAEGLAAARAAGIDLATAVRALSEGGVGSPNVIRHAPSMARGVHEDPPGFTAAGRLKDSIYGVQLEEKLGQTPRAGRAAMAAYQAMVDLGMGAAADSRLFEALQRGSGSGD